MAANGTGSLVFIDDWQDLLNTEDKTDSKKTPERTGKMAVVQASA